MDAIILMPKDEWPNAQLVVFDEYIPGKVTNEWFIPCFTGATNGLKFMPLSYLIEKYKFPETGKLRPAIVNYLSGYDPKKHKTIEYYQTNELIIEPYGQ